MPGVVGVHAARRAPRPTARAARWSLLPSPGSRPAASPLVARAVAGLARPCRRRPSAGGAAHRARRRCWGCRPSPPSSRLTSAYVSPATAQRDRHDPGDQDDGGPAVARPARGHGTPAARVAAAGTGCGGRRRPGLVRAPAPGSRPAAGRPRPSACTGPSDRRRARRPDGVPPAPIIRSILLGLARRAAARPGPCAAAPRSPGPADRPGAAAAAPRRRPRAGCSAGCSAGTGSCPRPPRTAARRATTGPTRGRACGPAPAPGARNSGEPITSPVMVSAELPSTVAMPKSVSTTRPSLDDAARWPASRPGAAPPPRARPAARPAPRAPMCAARCGVSGPSASRSVGQREPADQLHHDPGAAVLGGHVVHRDHVAVARSGPPPTPPAPAARTSARRRRRGSPAGRPHLLDGDLAVQHLVAGAPHDAHAALAERGQQPVAARDQTFTARFFGHAQPPSLASAVSHSVRFLPKSSSAQCGCRPLEHQSGSQRDDHERGPQRRGPADQRGRRAARASPGACPAPASTRPPSLDDGEPGRRRG